MCSLQGSITCIAPKPALVQSTTGGRLVDLSYSTTGTRRFEYQGWEVFPSLPVTRTVLLGLVHDHPCFDSPRQRPIMSDSW